MSEQPLLRVTGLGVRRGRVQVLHEVALEVRRGEVVAVLGPNGAGKSTLLEAVGGVLPSTGEIALTGRVATVLQTAGLASRSVRANVTLALSWWGVPRRERRTRATAALELMRADHLAGRFARSLSGGERRRVHLARGIAVAPDLLLLDEPFAGLDPESHAALARDTSAALREASGAVLVTLHDRADAWAMADRVIVMLEGRIVADAAPETLLASPPSVEVARFLGFDGRLTDGDQVHLTRPAHVRVASTDESVDWPAAGLVPATVTRTTRLQDGAHVELATDRGTVTALHPAFDLREGQRVGVRVDGGVRFPATRP